MSSSVLKLQIEALEKEGLGKTVSNPKLFTLDNQVASITQGVQIPVAGSGDTAPSFKDAALKLTVTPSIIGDGNVLLQVQVNNDSPDRADPSAVGAQQTAVPRAGSRRPLRPSTHCEGCHVLWGCPKPR